MNSEHSTKINTQHLQREAYLYIRQSTLRQVMENTESTERQYALRRRAVALGWSEERIVVIDSDLGKSGAERDRSGFQQLVADVGVGRAGIVMGLEVSRLARNCMDWHRLLEICALTNTLLLDEDGVYDPSHFNDRLLLGMKGTLSEAELHVLRARLQGGIVNKAQRGELRMRPPMGLIYTEQGRLVFDPDRSIQQALRLLFKTFERTGSASATVKTFRTQGLSFPRRRHQQGPGQGEVIWGELEHSQVLRVLHNPRYAGAFAFGQSRTRKMPDGNTLHQRLPEAQWQVLIRDQHEGYISWDQFQTNQKRLRENATALGADRRAPPREGSALLQGICLCGRCGRRMTVRYKAVRGRQAPYYICQAEGIKAAQAICQSIPGTAIDEAVARQLLATITPATIELTLAVEQELQAQHEQAQTLRQQQLERARYEAELARRRYLRCDPDNRLVADSLEAEWNQKLRLLRDVQEAIDQPRADAEALNEAKRERIRALAQDLPQLWHHQDTPIRERKRLTRLLIKDVTLIKETDVMQVHIRYPSGRCETLNLPPSLPSWKQWQTDPAIIEQIDRWLNNFTVGQIATRLNAAQWRSGKDQPFNARIVARLCRDYGLKSRYQRLRERGFLSVSEMAEQLNVTPVMVGRWRRQGHLIGHQFSDKSQYLYEPPGELPPVKYQRQRCSR